MNSVKGPGKRNTQKKTFLIYGKTRAKLQPGASSPGTKQYGDGQTNRPTDQPMDQLNTEKQLKNNIF
jgi:hypothetical protein